jgi:hypothetical protein
MVISPGGTLDHVAVDGSLRQMSGRLRVVNGLTLNGTATLEGNLNFTRMVFEGTQTLSGNGTVRFTDFNPILRVLEPAGGTLTIGNQMTIAGGAGTIGNADTPLINQGTITADGSEAQLRIYGNPFTNNGTIQELNGGRVTVNP